MRAITILLGLGSLSAYAGRVDLLTAGEAVIKAGEETTVSCQAKPVEPVGARLVVGGGAKVYAVSTNCEKIKTNGLVIERDQKARSGRIISCGGKSYTLILALDDKNSIYVTDEKNESKILQMAVVESDDTVQID